MTPALLGRMLAHARGAAPREACGVIISGKDSLAEYIPCRNVADDPENDFEFSHIDLIDAEDKGHILGYVHSHPGAAGCEPGAVDTERQKVTQLPWWVVKPETSEWKRFGDVPFSHRVFAWGVNDCYSLVYDYFPGVPDFLREPDFWKTTNLFMENLSLAGFSVVRDEPKVGDGLLFAVKSDVINHCAICVGSGIILHHLPGRLSIVEPMGAWVRSLKAVVRRSVC